jgi:hypothetical protein
MPQPTLWPFLRKRLPVKEHRLQLLQLLNLLAHNLRFLFCVDFEQRKQEDWFVGKLVFNEVEMFRLTARCRVPTYAIGDRNIPM